MTVLLTAAQMRAIEAEAIASGAVTGLDLMERAGRGVVEAILEEWPELALTPHSAMVLCGPGNNGGDGFVVARLLRERGWEVEVFLQGAPEQLPPDARANYRRWAALGEVGPLDDFGTLAVAGNTAISGSRPGGAPVVVDAVFGTGLARPPEGRLADILGQIRRAARDGQTKVVAIDLPSGLCTDSGRMIGEAAGACLTVTFHRTKPGHWLAEGPSCCGRLRVCDIGLARSHLSGSGEGADGFRTPAGAAPSLGEVPGPASGNAIRLITTARLPAKAPDSHKFTHGHALVLSGPAGRTGAARLAARGALRIGAGLVTVGAPSSALAEHAARLDAIMLREIRDAAALVDLLKDDRINAIGVGPGLGTGDNAAELVAAALAARRPSVLDADALTLLSRDRALFDDLHDQCVLTPHAGEFARLFPDLAEKLAAAATKGPATSKADVTREAAGRAGCTILFKGPDTVVAGPDGLCSVNSAHYDRAAPWLATAGSGDVLTGFITGLLARGLAPMLAAEAAAWLHVECALAFGPGLISEDLPDVLPQVLSRLIAGGAGAA
jgi:hydroxyethylthiazole kinase-like uncharacterized protein yjeF